MAAGTDEGRAFGDALARALDIRPRAWLGAEVARLCGKETPITASAVAQWISGDAEPARNYVFAAEKVLELKPGTLSRLLGYLPVDAKPALSVMDAIDADTRLTDTAKRMLKSSYQAAVQ